MTKIEWGWAKSANGRKQRKFGEGDQRRTLCANGGRKWCERCAARSEIDWARKRFAGKQFRRRRPDGQFLRQLQPWAQNQSECGGNLGEFGAGEGAGQAAAQRSHAFGVLSEGVGWGPLRNCAAALEMQRVLGRAPYKNQQLRGRTCTADARNEASQLKIDENHNTQTAASAIRMTRFCCVSKMAQQAHFKHSPTQCHVIAAAATSAAAAAACTPFHHVPCVPGDTAVHVASANATVAALPGCCCCRHRRRRCCTVRCVHFKPLC